MVSDSARKVWQAYYNNASKAVDAFGNTIYYEKYGGDSQGSWEIDHIWPKNFDGEEGADTYSNVQPLSHKSNQTKSNNINGVINGMKYFVQKISSQNSKVVGRLAVYRNGSYVWAYNKPNY